MTTPKPRLRRCTGCKNMIDKRELARVVRSPQGTFSYDTTGKSPGRGAYICKSSDCMTQAIKTKGLERSFKCAIPPEVYDKLKEEIM